MAEAWIEPMGDGDTLVLRAGGAWSIAEAAGLDRKLEALQVPASHDVRIDLGGIESLDTAGAWLVLRLARGLRARGSEVRIENLADDFAPLLDRVGQGPAAAVPGSRRRSSAVIAGLSFIGAGTVEFAANVAGHLSFFGLVAAAIARAVRRPGRVRVTSLVAHMERVGVSALPIVGLLSFLIGIVTAYQGADQLRRFGAEILTVDILGLGFLREMGVMLAAIIIAGRSGSAFAAEIGAMEVNEEVDAMRTLALDPIELLVLPRFFALVITLPLLAFYANFMGLLGGALLCWLVLGIPLPVYLDELRHAASMWSFWLGIIKAPFFAGAIAITGCYEGLKVERSAESVGRHTTSAVVQAIFLVIVIDAAFSVLFASLHI